MTITAKYAATCPACHLAIAAGSKIEWSKGNPAKHSACAASPVAPTARVAPAQNRAARYYGGSRSRACKTGGNCSSSGSGKGCGSDECDGY